MSTGFLKELNGAEVEAEELQINEKFCELLKNNDFQNLIDFMSAPLENSYRSVPERLTVGLDLESPNGPHRVYLKRHWCDKAGHTDAPKDEALSEWENLNQLASEGIQVPQAMAVGWGKISGHSCAFIMMNEVPGTQADHFIEEHFPNPESPVLKKFMKKLAVFAAHFHKAGYNHRDFYLCHTFVEQLEDDWKFYLIDLQRVQKRKFWRKRWIVKDLAQFNYSALKLVDDEGRRIFYDTWCKETGVNPKSLSKAVQKKTDKMVKRELQGKVR